MWSSFLLGWLDLACANPRLALGCRVAGYGALRPHLISISLNGTRMLLKGPVLNLDALVSAGHSWNFCLRLGGHKSYFDKLWIPSLPSPRRCPVIITQNTPFRELGVPKIQRRCIERTLLIPSRNEGLQVTIRDLHIALVKKKPLSLASPLLAFNSCRHKNLWGPLSEDASRRQCCPSGSLL